MPRTGVGADAQGQHPSSQDGNIDFSFLPRALVEKCKPFIIRYHELNGFSGSFVAL
jgi:hypothetical protein